MEAPEGCPAEIYKIMKQVCYWYNCMVWFNVVEVMCTYWVLVVIHHFYVLIITQCLSPFQISFVVWSEVFLLAVFAGFGPVLSQSHAHSWVKNCMHVLGQLWCIYLSFSCANFLNSVFFLFTFIQVNTIILLLIFSLHAGFFYLCVLWNHISTTLITETILYRLGSFIPKRGQIFTK